MDQQTLLYVMTAFVVIAGVALVIQMAVMIGMYRATKAAEQRLALMLPKVENLLPKVENLMTTSQAAIDQGRAQILQITQQTNEILSTAKTQLNRVDEVLADASQRARQQLEHAERVIDDTLGKAQQTINTVHTGVMRPLRELQGISVGVKTALAFLAKGARPSVAQVTQDEEMFI
jgi:ElaB/YqjD/DUF883 family membrane-anchored ribosome-binding protein